MPRAFHLQSCVKLYTDSGEKVWEGCGETGKGLEGPVPTAPAPAAVVGAGCAAPAALVVAVGGAGRGRSQVEDGGRPRQRGRQRRRVLADHTEELPCNTPDTCQLTAAAGIRHGDGSCKPTAHRGSARQARSPAPPPVRGPGGPTARRPARGPRLPAGDENRHSAAPPSPFSRRFNTDGEGVSSNWRNSRRRLAAPSPTLTCGLFGFGVHISPTCPRGLFGPPASSSSGLKTATRSPGAPRRPRLR